MICDAVTGKVYMVTETKAVRENSDGPRASEAPRLEPSKFVYFEYLGRTASYPHVVCQMKDHGLSEQERQRVSELIERFRAWKIASRLVKLYRYFAEQVGAVVGMVLF